MANFVVSTSQVVPQALASGESGVVTQLGAISLAGTAVAMAGNTGLAVYGAVTSTNSSAAVSYVGSGTSIILGAQGSIVSLFGTAVSGSTTGTATLSNSGQILGRAGGVHVNMDTTGSLLLENSGVIRASAGDGVRSGGDYLYLFNSGEIIGMANAEGVATDALNVEIHNTGIISSFEQFLNAGSSCLIVNSGIFLRNVSMGAGNDRYRGETGEVQGTLSGGTGQDVLRTGANSDNILGGSGNDRIIAGLGDDSQFGDSGDDVFLGGAGSDYHDGGTGRDLVDFRDSGAGIEVDLRQGEGFGGDAEGDQFFGIEMLRGSAFADTLIGDTQGNFLRGGLGADYLAGGEGNDTLRGEAGADTLLGGTGVDTVTYALARDGVNVSLASAGAAAGGSAQGDVLQGIENLVGSAGFDTLTGSTGANLIEGGGGDDVIRGLTGNDTLSGNAGIDVFIFAPHEGTDRITDFAIGGDLIDLQAYGITDINEVLAVMEVMEDGVSTMFDFNAINIASTLILENRLFLNPGLVAASFILADPA